MMPAPQKAVASVMIHPEARHHSRSNRAGLLVLLAASFLFAKTAPAPAGLPAPVTLPFPRSVHSVFTLPYPNKVAVETKAGDAGYQFAIVTFVDRDLFIVDTISTDDFKGGTISVLGALDDKKLLLLLPAGIDVLDLKLKMVTDEYATVSPRADLEPQYFQAVLTSTDPLSVIAEVQPSIDADGVVDPTQHSLVYDEVVRKKTKGRISLIHPLKEPPPVFLSPELIIYRNKRRDPSEPWKALDKALSPVRHPLCAVLDTAYARAAIFGIALSQQCRKAIVFSIEGSNSRPELSCVSWKDGRVTPIVVAGGDLTGLRNLMVSPSGRWAFFTASIDNAGKQWMGHCLLDLDAASSPFPRILASASKNDRVAWINGGESLAIFGEGKISVWELPKNTANIVQARDAKKKGSRQKRNGL